MRRLLAIALGAALLYSMTAYAGQTGETLALCNQVQEKSRSTTDMNAYYDSKIEMGGTMLQNESPSPMDMRLEMNIKMSHPTDPGRMHYVVYSRMTRPDSEQITFSMYYLDGYCYMGVLGQKVKYPMAMTGIAKQSMVSVSVLDVLTDIMRDLNPWDEGENEVVGFTIDDTKMNEYLQTVLNSTGLTGMVDRTGIDLCNMRGEHAVNPSDGMIKMRLKMGMDMTIRDQTVTINLDGDVGIADPGRPADAPVPNAAEYTDMTVATAAD